MRAATPTACAKARFRTVWEGIRTGHRTTSPGRRYAEPIAGVQWALEGIGFMPLTRGEAIRYDADLMAFKFTMRNGQQIVQCQISRAALGDMAGGRIGSVARDLPAQFEAHRERIEAIASAQFDQTSNEETRLVSIFAKHIPSSTAQKKRRVSRHRSGRCIR